MRKMMIRVGLISLWMVLSAIPVVAAESVQVTGEGKSVV